MSFGVEDRDTTSLCKDIDEIIDLLATLGSSKEYLDKDLVPTSEGMKIIRRVIKLMKEKKLPCTSIVEKLIQGYHYMSDVYDCLISTFPQCEK
jgi:hypothetical protein